MSDPKNQRADGCSVFFSILLGLLFVSSYFIFQMFFDIDDNKEDTSMLPNKRAEYISNFNNESENFISKVDSYYTDKNKSLESFMQETVELSKNKSIKSER